MGKEVSFEKEVDKRLPMVWVCACGCPTFMLHTTGAAECIECNSLQVVEEHDYHPRRWVRKDKEIQQ